MELNNVVILEFDLFKVHFIVYKILVQLDCWFQYSISKGKIQQLLFYNRKKIWDQWVSMVLMQGHIEVRGFLYFF